MNPVVFRALQRLKHLDDPAFLRTFRQVEREEWLSHNELAELAWERQKMLVRQAYLHSSFYRGKYDAAGFHPDQLQHPEDFVRVPLLTRDEVRGHIEEIVCDNAHRARLAPAYTSGSTGVPAMIYHDIWAEAPALLAQYSRTLARWGMKLGSKTAVLSGRRRRGVTPRYKTPEHLRRFLTNSVWLDAYETLASERMICFVKLLESFRPDLMWSYVSAMEALARFLDERGGARFQPKAIWLTAESTHAQQKELIERVLRSVVCDMYGSVEAEYCAGECEQREGLHVNTDLRTVEVVDDIGQSCRPRGIGEIVVTDLINYAAPLIRYRTGDLGSLLDRACSCGRGLPLIGSVIGRLIDMFVLPDGSQIYGGLFATFFYDHINEVRRFQVHQIDRDAAIVRIVPTLSCKREELSAQVLRAFRDYTSGKMRFDIRFVERIDQEASGKFRYLKSDISRPHAS